MLRGIEPPLRLSAYRLIAFDMDSALISIECVDEIVDAVGRKAEVAAITEAAMRGEITDFKDSRRRRVALLRGVSVSDLAQVRRARRRLSPGAAELALDFARNNLPEIEHGRPRHAASATTPPPSKRGEIIHHSSFSGGHLAREVVHCRPRWFDGDAP